MSIVRADGHEAVFLEKHGEGNSAQITRDVVLWQEEGGIVIGLIDSERPGDRALRSAESFPNFLGYRKKEEPDTPIAAAPGWWVEFAEESFEQGILFSVPVLGWVVCRDGWGIKAITPPSSDGYSEPETAGPLARFVYKPERRDTDA